MSTKTEQLIAQKQKEIEQLRESAYRQELIDVLSDKKSTEETVATASKAFFDNYMKKKRQENLQKARAEKDKQKAQAQPA